VNTRWRHFRAALHFVTSLPASPGNASGLPPHEAARLVPLVGILVGLCGAAVYWLGSQAWPTSVAVVLSMLATTLLDARGRGFGAVYWIFVLLVKYNALMALSAANVPVPLPPFVTLGLIMVAGQAASRALVVSVMASAIAPAAAPIPFRVTAYDLSVALIIGFAPAALLGIPGLIGLVSAITLRLVLTAVILPRLGIRNRERLYVAQQLTELCFYLGALATWKYV
jgi:adenosylcobinamide-GDP ribazoletransferase